MGTDKRERQKANRALKQQHEQRTARNQAMKRRGLRIGLGVVAALAGVVIIAWVGGAFDGDEAIAPSPDTAAPSDTAPDTSTGDTVAGDAPATSVADDVLPVGCPDPDGADAPRTQFTQAPPMCISDTVDYSAVVSTNLGEYTVEFDAERAPLTVNNFVTLARFGYFDDTECHRIIPEFVAQCGDPTATGTGGPGYTFADELPEAGEYQLGSLAMANSGPDTNGSQFFVITGDDGAALPPQYSLFGQVTDGLDTVAAMNAAGNPDPAAGGVPPLEEVRILSVEIIES